MPAAIARAGLDTSCVLALLCDWHEFHPITFASFEELLARRIRFVLPVHALLEAFSVLTRLPGRHRLNPDDTLRLLRANFPDLAEVVGLSPEHAWSSIQRLAAHALGGGRVYDAAIATAAWQAGARLLLTWNTRDFLAVAPPGLEVREPSRTG